MLSAPAVNGAEQTCVPAVGPSPSCPHSASPHAATEPSATTARVWALPQAARPTRQCSSAAMREKRGACARPRRPSCPASLLPARYSSPSPVKGRGGGPRRLSQPGSPPLHQPRTAQSPLRDSPVTTAVCWEPAEMSTTSRPCTAPTTRHGAATSSEAPSPSPSWPASLAPHT